MFFLIVALVVSDRVDMAELNHFYGRDGSLVFSQVVWWDWNVSEGRWDVVDWRLLKDVSVEIPEAKRAWELAHPDGPPYVPLFIGGHATPVRCGSRWVSEWHDEKSGKPRRVIAAFFKESWTDWDVELVAREDKPQERRRGLKR